MGLCGRSYMDKGATKKLGINIYPSLWTYIYIYMLIAHFAVLAELKMVRRILLPVLVELIQSNPSYPLKKELPIEIWDWVGYSMLELVFALIMLDGRWPAYKDWIIWYCYTETDCAMRKVILRIRAVGGWEGESWYEDRGGGGRKNCFVHFSQVDMRYNTLRQCFGWEEDTSTTLLFRTFSQKYLEN